MSSLTSKDRVSLCSFTFADGRRCRTPRLRDNPRFCPYHAQKEARARAAQSLGKDLAHFFSNNYVSACDLSTVLARLIPAVVRGEVKPRAARTVAYLAQTLMQSIHISQDEYINAFGTDGWRKCLRASVNGNYNYRFPPASKPEPPQSHPAEPQPQPVQTPLNCNSSLAAHDSPLPRAPQSEIPTLSGPAPSPRTPLPPTSAEFAQHLLAGRNLSRPAPETGGDSLHNRRSHLLRPVPIRSGASRGPCRDLVGRQVPVRPHNQPRLRPPRQSQYKPLQLPLPPQLRPRHQWPLNPHPQLNPS